ncbi:MAG: hypothetical protein ACI956_001648 [Nonlabens sp.]|jgi:hypothetical protein
MISMNDSQDLTARDAVHPPNFFVIGVVKGGTTSLYHYLDQHPEIYLPPIKETNHFAAKDIIEENFLDGYAQDVRINLDAYIKSGMKQQVHIAHVDSPDHYNALFSKVKNEKAIGEISNSYMICPSSASEIHTFNPSAKILVVLRNPIRRAWSQYLMNLRESKSSAPDFIEELQKDHRANPKGWGVNHQYLELGMYAKQLKSYIDLFGKDRVLPIFYEQYRDNPNDVLRRISEFLEVDPNYTFDFSSESNKASMPRSKVLNKLLVSSGLVKAVKDLTPKKLRSGFAKILYSDRNMPSIMPAEVDWLRAYYAQEVKDLSELIEQDAGEYWADFKED